MSLTVPNVTTLVSELTDELGENSSDTDVVSRITRWLNETFEDILSRQTDWKWARKLEEFLVKARYNTGTVSITQDSTTVTGVGTTWDTDLVNQLFWIAGSGVNYRVASIDSTTQLTLTTAFQEDNVSGDTYELVTDFYVLDNQLFEAGIIDIVNPYKTDPLEEVDISDMIRINPKRRSLGDPAYYSIVGVEDATASTNPGGPVIFFEKFPTVNRMFTIIAHKQFGRFATTDKFPIPAKYYRRVLTNGVKMLAKDFDSQDPSTAMRLFEKDIRFMIQENTKVGKRQRRLRETDLPDRAGVQGAKYPSNYPFIGNW